MATRRTSAIPKYNLVGDVARVYVCVQEDIGFPRGGEEGKGSGIVYTPVYVARALLVHWAIRTPQDTVLDPGSGRGIFLFEAFRRLLSLGAAPSHARNLLHGIEQDAISFRQLVRDLESFAGGRLPHLKQGNLFDHRFPPLDAVVGNPPYVRRWWLDNLDLLRDRLPEDVRELRLTRLTDLACYFVIYCARFLKPGGRLALVVSDGWLDADYGVPFKEFLLGQFKLRRIVAFQHRVFADVLIRPVLILAERRSEAVRSPAGTRTMFVLSPGGSDRPSRTFSVDSLVKRAEHTVVLHGGELRPKKAWGQYLNAPPVYFRLMRRNDFRPLGEYFESRIGLQTFGKSFFIIPAAAVRELGLERRFLHPLILSPRELERPVLMEGQAPNYFLFWCDLPRGALEGTQAGRYVEFWEKSRVTARGGKGEVVGIQNLPRLRRAARDPWYNIKSEVKRRGIYPLLVPRRILDSYVVAWNLAGFAPAENFLELSPRRGVDMEGALALLNSSLAELCLRANAHLYGGGVYNLNPGELKEIRLPRLDGLSQESLIVLRRAFKEYRGARPPMREALDQAVGEAFGLSGEVSRAARDGVERLKNLSRDVKASPDGTLFASPRTRQQSKADILEQAKV